MNAISHTRVQRASLRDWSVSGRFLDRATRLCRLGLEIAQEAYETVGGVFAVPLRQLPYEKYLDRLDDHLLRDIGYERPKGPKLDVYL